MLARSMTVSTISSIRAGRGMSIDAVRKLASKLREHDTFPLQIAITATGTAFRFQFGLIDSLSHSGGRGAMQRVLGKRVGLKSKLCHLVNRDAPSVSAAR